MQRRRLSNTDFLISPVALGCWPIAGITSEAATESESLATICAALDLGINHLDTAYLYGYAGESERLVGRAIAGRRDEVVLATKAGLYFDADRRRVFDARPETLRRHCEESLTRLGVDCVDLLYLHAADGRTPIIESAAALQRLREEGKTRAVGVSNLSVEQMEEFAAVCPIAAVQPPFNMLQRQAQADVIPWAAEHGAAVLVYWPLMKGLLTGKFSRDHVFPPSDSRSRYPSYQGDEWRKNQDFLDVLRQIARESGRTVTQVVVNWTIHQPNITAALCGAKRPDQIAETAGGCGWRLSDDHLTRIDAALTRRGDPVPRSAL